MKEYKVGDIVTIKSLDWYNEHKDENGDVDVPRSFISDMSKHCGETTVITKVSAILQNYYNVECDEGRWNWSAEMFEGNEEETMKYKVGDKVKLKSQEWYDNEEKDSDGYVRSSGPIPFNRDMCKYLGKVATITKADGNSYYLDIDGGYWNWVDYMIECKVDDVEPKQSFNEGDFVQIKSEEWFEENKDDEEGIIVENDITFDEEYCGKVGEIVEYDSSDETYKVQFNPDNDENYTWVTANWIDKADKPENWVEEDDEESDDEISNEIEEGDWVMVADKYSEMSPREDWTVAKFVAPRSKGIDTEEGIWNYCVEWTAFEPENWEVTLKHIYTGKDKKLIKVNKDE